MGKVSKPKIIHKNQVNILEQPIISVQKNHITVVSRNNKEYDVNLSDIVKMTMTIEKGDIAVIKTFPTGWLVTDIKKQIKEEILTEDEEYLELKRQEQELEDIGWGVY